MNDCSLGLAYGSINRASLSPLQTAIITPTPPTHLLRSEDSAEFTVRRFVHPLVLVFVGELSSDADIWNE